MSPEFRSTVESLPSYFQSHFNADRTSFYDQSLLGLGFTLEELVEEEFKVGNVVTSKISNRRNDRSQILDIHPMDREPRNYTSDAEIINFGEDSLYVWERNAWKLKECLLGEQAPSDDDVKIFFENRVKENADLSLIGLGKDHKIGSFMEKYTLGNSHINIDDTYEWLEFKGDMEPFLVDLELYFELERYFRRKELLSEGELIDPVIYFSEVSGRIAVSLEGEKVYFHTLWSFIKLDENADNIIEKKRIKYKD